MRPFIVIRRYEKSDEISRKDLIKQFVMSFAFDAFISCLFREIFVQLIVLVAAIMFIFLGLPLAICLSSIPLVIIFMYVSVYGTYFTKALEISSDPITTCWIAEAFEPYVLSFSVSENQREYDVVNESRLKSDEAEIKRMRRTIVGTISINDHRNLPGSGWLSHFAVKPKFNFDKAAEALVKRSLKHGVDVDYCTIEMATTECQFELRELLLKIGFNMKQIYHRYVLGSSSFRIMKSQMGIDLTTWKLSKNK